jgi:preprotein translocase subunit SecG
MGVIAILLLVVLAVSAVMLIGLVLVQDEQGEGFAGFFGGASTTAFGSRTGNVLTRFTAVLAALFLVCCMGLAWQMSRTSDAGDVVGKAREQALSGGTTQWWVESSAEPATTAPGTPAGSGGK